MAKRKRVRRDWPTVVQAQATSGLSITEYCRKHDISPGLFRRWRQHCEPTSVTPGGFVELRPVDGQRSASGVTVIIEGGCRVELQPGFDAATLERVLSCVTRSVPCSP